MSLIHNTGEASPSLKSIFQSSVQSTVLGFALLGFGANALANESAETEATNETPKTSSAKTPLFSDEPKKVRLDIDFDGVELEYRPNEHSLITTYVEPRFDKLSYDGIAGGIRGYYQFDRNLFVFGGVERFDGQQIVRAGGGYESVNYSFEGGQARFIDRRYFGVETAWRSRTENTLRVTYTYEHDFSEQASRVLGDFGRNMSREYGVFVDGRDKRWDMGATLGFFKPVNFTFRDNRHMWRVGVVGEFSGRDGNSVHLVARKGRRIGNDITFSQPRLGY